MTPDRSALGSPSKASELDFIILHTLTNILELHDLARQGLLFQVIFHHNCKRDDVPLMCIRTPSEIEMGLGMLPRGEMRLSGPRRAVGD